MTNYSLFFLLLVIPISVFSDNHQPPPPPPMQLHGHNPPPPPPPVQQHQLNNIIDALIGAGDFNNWANMLSASDLFMFPLSATLFVPSDDSIFPFPVPVPTSSTTAAAFDPLIVPYHIVPQRLTFSQLTLFKPFSRLPTLLPSKTILITNTSPSNFTLDASHISHHDLYVTSAIAVHGIASLLNYTTFGGGGGGGGAADAIAPPPPSPSIFQSDAGCCFYGVSAFVLLLIPWGIL
ncbi:hypothetical protein PTKIN_Ptkin18bG0015300 [Pterospermum kingtungense]